MKTKTKKISLLAISTIALAMPFAANATAKSFIALDGATTYITPGTTGTLYADTTAQAVSTYNLSDGDTLVSNFVKVTGAGSVNTYFTVAPNTPLFSASATIVPPSANGLTYQLLDYSKGNAVVSLSAPAVGSTSYTYASLKAGDIYDFKVSFKGITASTITSSITVAAIPEPEQWAMMMVGLFLVAAKVTKTKKSATLLMPFNA
jgi:hypothetical protein